MINNSVLGKRCRVCETNIRSGHMARHRKTHVLKQRLKAFELFVETHFTQRSRPECHNFPAVGVKQMARPVVDSTEISGADNRNSSAVGVQQRARSVVFSTEQTQKSQKLYYTVRHQFCSRPKKVVSRTATLQQKPYCTMRDHILNYRIGILSLNKSLHH